MQRFVFPFLFALVAAQTRWRQNQYVQDDGILPWQPCWAQQSMGHAPPLTTFVTEDGTSYDLRVLGGSVLGASAEDGEPISFDKVELALYYSTTNASCPLDSGAHCTNPHTWNTSRLTCLFVQGAFLDMDMMVPANVTEYAHGLEVECPLPTNSLPDAFNIQLLLANQWLVTIPFCYEQVSTAYEVAICTEPFWWSGSHTNHSFWNPDGFKQTLFDQFVVYHLQMQGAQMRINDCHSDFRLHAQEYNEAFFHQFSYRSGWARDPLAPVAYSNCLRHEHHAETACHWEHRFRARWTMIVHAADNFVHPRSAPSLDTLLRTRRFDMDASEYSVPIILGTNGNLSNTTGPTLFHRFPMVGPENEFGDTRHTPLFNPRHASFSWVHWIQMNMETSGGNARFTSRRLSGETRKQIDLETIHFMGIERAAFRDRPAATLREQGSRVLGDRLMELMSRE